MSDTLIAAILSVLAVVILAPIANHLIVMYRERRSLRASLSVSASPVPALLAKALYEQRVTLPFDGPVVEGSLNWKQLEALRSVRGYVRLTLHNPGKRKLNAVTVALTNHPYDHLYQIDDHIELGGPRENRILLGELQPNQSRILHIWTEVPYADWHYSRLPGVFEISADELDKRHLRLPFPVYLASLLRRRFNLAVWSFYVICAFLLLWRWLPELKQMLFRS